MRKTLHFLVLALLSGGAFLWTGASQAQDRGVRPLPTRPPNYQPNFPPNRMPGWDWWRTYPWSPYNYGRNPYNPAWYPPGYFYPPVYAPSAGPVYTGPTYYGVTFDAAQAPIPHPSGGNRVPPVNAAGIQLLVPDRFADFWFDGTKESSIGTDRYYVTPDLQGKPRQYDVKVSWKRGGQTQTEERTITVHPGKTTVVDFSSK